MSNTGLSKNDIRQIKMALSQFSGIKDTILFGSRAKGSHKKGFDVDLAIQFSSPEHPPIQLIHDQLEEITPLPYFFDVIDIDSIQKP